MFAATVLLCIGSMVPADVLTVRDLSPFSELDTTVKELPIETPRTYAGVAKELSQIAKTPLEKARAAYVWTASNVTYSIDRRRDAASALADLTGDCDAHAAVFSSLCKILGVECTNVGGNVRFAVPPGPGFAEETRPLAEGQWMVTHTWNAIRIDGRWGLVDSTMGGGSSPKNGTVAPADDYFLADPAILATDHVPDKPEWCLAPVPADLPHTPIARPLTWRMGITQTDLASDARRDENQIVLRPKLAWRKGMRAALQTEAGSVPDRVLLQPTPEGMELRLRPSAPASIVWLGVPVDGRWQPLVGYPIAGTVNGRFPKVMTRFYDSGASLSGPFDSTIPAGRPAEIRLRAPGAEAVVAFQGNDIAGKFVRDGDAWVLRTAPFAGALEVMASYDDPHKFQALLTYDVK